MAIEPTIATLVRRWRGRALLTQEQVAHRTGLSVRTIRRLESGSLLRPRNDSLRLLADALALSDAERTQLVAAARDGSAPAQPAPPLIPKQLPADVAGFTGRTRYLREMDHLLSDDGGTQTAVVISAIAGTAGVGKTALAVHWAHRVADHFPDGQLYLNLRGFDPGGTPVEPAVAIRVLLDALAVTQARVPVGVDAQTALYRSLLADRRMLVLLDNVRDAEQVRPLLPGTPGCLAVVTSRHDLTGLIATEGARPVVLDLLSTVEARELLARRVGGERVAAEPEPVDEIVTLCARLPLALAVAAARAAARPDLALADLAAELRDARGRLDALDTGDTVTDIRAVLFWSYQCLGAGAARLFRLLGLHPGPDVSAAAVASLAGIPPRQVRPLLAELTRAHLVTEHAPGRYAFHDLLRAYASELALAFDRDDQRGAASRRTLDHYLHTAHAASRLVDPHREPIDLPPLRTGTTPEHPADYGQALAWFIAERPVLLAAIAHAAGHGLDTHSWQLAWTLAHFLSQRGHWHDLVAAESTAVTAAGRLADPLAQARVRRILAVAYVHLGRLDDAHTHLRHVLDVYRRVGDHTGQADTHLHLASMLERRGRFGDALDHAGQALDLHAVTVNRSGQANALNWVGWLHALLGDHKQAIAHCEQAVSMFEELDYGQGLAATWDSLGYAHDHLGHHTEAVTCYRRSVDLYRDLGDRYGEADALSHLGDAFADGDPDAADKAWQEALAILDELDHPDADGVRARLSHHGGTPGPPSPDDAAPRGDTARTS